MSWYVKYGNPHWDADELWSTMGHLYKGGVWLKKKSVLQADGNYSTEHSADGTTDMRTTYKIYSNTCTIGLPSATDANNYFYLPALGSYGSGYLVDVGSYSCYWSSSAEPRKIGINIDAYYLAFSKTGIGVASYRREFGFTAQPFTDFGGD